MARAFAALLGVALSSPAAALACPQCAGRNDGGLTRTVLLGAFVMFPFALVWTVWRILRAEAARSGSHIDSGS